MGHTHEDVDQMFSRFSVALKEKDVFTIEELQAIIKDSFTFRGEKPELHVINKVHVGNTSHVMGEYD